MSNHTIQNDKFRMTVSESAPDRIVVSLTDKRTNESRILKGFSGILAQQHALSFARNFFDDPENQPTES